MEGMTEKKHKKETKHEEEAVEIPVEAVAEAEAGTDTEPRVEGQVSASRPRTYWLPMSMGTATPSSSRPTPPG